jgi:hypothetical protein
MTTSQRIPELEGIQFTGHESVRKYSQALRDLNRDLAHEAEFAAEELQVVLSAQKGHPLLAGLDVRLRARRVARRLHRAAELSAGAAIEAVKLYAEFRIQFSEVITPKESKNRRNFDFNDHDD